MNAPVLAGASQLLSGPRLVAIVLLPVPVPVVLLLLLLLLLLAIPSPLSPVPAHGVVSGVTRASVVNW